MNLNFTDAEWTESRRLAVAMLVAAVRDDTTFLMDLVGELEDAGDWVRTLMGVAMAGGHYIRAGGSTPEKIEAWCEQVLFENAMIGDSE